MIIDDSNELDRLLENIHDKRALIVPILTDHQSHPSVNRISCLYVYTEDELERLIPIHHTEQIQGFSERLQEFLDLKSIFVHDKKIWLQMGGNNDVYDVKTLWWYTYGEAYNETHYHTASHQFYWRRHVNLNHINTIIPLMNHAAMCQKIRKYAWPMIMNSKLSDSYKTFNSLYPQTFANIESNGMQINTQFTMNHLIHSGRVYSQYNYHTTTGRPSNAFRGFNYAAMNKEDGTRDAFCSRFDQGALVEMDFDAYHIRLIARLIGYQLPDTSIHEYFGKFYFSTDTLTKEQYEQSKQITFRLLYGGIDREFLHIPFFKQVNDYIWNVWNHWKTKGYIKTPIDKRTLSSDNLNDMTKNKLFNYLLQAVETEFSVRKLSEVQYLLKDYQSKLVLYTYDSLLFDVSYPEAKEVLSNVKLILERGGFPVKCKVGNIYSKLKDIKL